MSTFSHLNPLFDQLQIFLGENTNIKNKFYQKISYLTCLKKMVIYIFTAQARKQANVSHTNYVVCNRTPLLRKELDFIQ